MYLCEEQACNDATMDTHHFHTHPITHLSPNPSIHTALPRPRHPPLLHHPALTPRTYNSQPIPTYTRTHTHTTTPSHRTRRSARG